MNLKQLLKTAVFSKDMKRIGKVVDLNIDLENRSLKELVVKIDGVEAKKIWKGLISIRSPKIVVPAELVSTAKDAIQVQHALEELKDKVKKL